MGSISDHSNSPDTFEEDWNFAMQLSNASVLPMVIKALIELEVFEIMSKCGPGAHLSASEVASHLPTSNQQAAAANLDRVLRLLASFSVLTCTSRTRADGCVERVYGLASVCKLLVKNQDGASLATMTLLTQDRVFLDMWAFTSAPNLALQNHASASSDSLTAQFNQLQQLQHASNVSAVTQANCTELPTPAGSSGGQGNQQLQNSSREETETDPQKRLQATLQLAATLLQQIQQQAKAADQW